MPYSPATYDEKPYNRCITCAHIGTDCDGPNFLAMSTERWCEWCRFRKEYLGTSNASISEASGVSEITIKRVMSGTVSGVNAETMRSITKVLVNGTWGQYPCAIAAHGEPEELKASADECERLKASISEIRADDQRKIDHLKAQIAQQDRLLQDRYEFLKQKDVLIDRREAEIAQKEKEISLRDESIRVDKRTKKTLCWLLAVSVTFLIALLVIICGALVIDYRYPDRGFFWVDRSMIFPDMSTWDQIKAFFGVHI